MSEDLEPAAAAQAPAAEALTAEQRAQFLAYIEEHRGSSVREACEHAGIKRHQVRALKRVDSEFADDYREARGYGDERIRTELARRAIDGVEDPITNKDGEIVGHRTVYSDRLLALMAKAHLPEYRDVSRLELAGRDGGPVEVQVQHDYGLLLTKLEQYGLVRRGPAAVVDAETHQVLPARTD